MADAIVDAMAEVDPLPAATDQMAALGLVVFAVFEEMPEADRPAAIEAFRTVVGRHLDSS